MSEDFGRLYRELMSGLYSEEELNRIKSSTIGISGVGGSVGGYLFDVLVRKGFENFNLAEPEHYEKRNLSRQLFANTSTLGTPKIEAALNYVRLINPDVRCKTYHKIDLSTIDEFVSRSTIIAYQAESFSPWVLTHYKCSKYGIPFVNVARKGNLRTTMRLLVTDYRSNLNSFRIQSVNFASFGIFNELERRIIDAFEAGEVTKELLDEADSVHIIYKKNKRFKTVHKQFPDTGSIKDKFPSDYFKRYTDPEICLIAGAMASRAVTDLVIGRKTRISEINIFTPK